jgi:integrase
VCMGANGEQMGKRGQNEGSIYKRSDGRWAASLSLGYHGGKLRRKTFYGKTRREVQEKLTTALHEVQMGASPTPTSRQLLGPFLSQWVEEVAKPTVRVSTYVKYANNIRKHINPELGRTPLAKLSAEAVQALYNRKLAEGLSPRTIRGVHVTLRRALGHAVRWKVVSQNVAQLVELPRARRAEPRILTADQARHLLQVAQGHRHEALYVLALTTGMREGELLGLKWQDVDLEAGSIQLRRTLAYITGYGYVEEEPKTDSGRRRITLSSLAIAALKAHHARQLARRLKAGDGWVENDRVFCTRDGRPISVWTLYMRSFLPLLEKAGLPRVRFHSLRHSSASLLLSLGIHPKVVQELLGHAEISITMDTYSHLLPTLQKDAVEKLGDLLRPAQQENR